MLDSSLGLLNEYRTRAETDASTGLHIRSTDLLARYGGEEFAVMMPATPIPKAFASVERLRRRIHGAPLTLVTTGATLHMTVSIGIAECLVGWTLDDLLQAADQALYQAKHNGRNQIRLWTTAFHT